MPKIIQLKDNNGFTYPKTIFKTVLNLSLKAGNSITDTRISNASAVIIYYNIFGNNYRKSFFIPSGDTEWFEDIFYREGFSIYVAVKWSINQIIVSQYSTVNDTVKVIGYSLLS